MRKPVAQADLVYPQARLLVFARLPRPGRVKTRLLPDLNAAQACDLHRALIMHVLDIAVSARFAPVQFWYCAADDALADDEQAFLQQIQQQFAVDVFRQQGTDLGERMAHALETALKNAEFALITGADVVSLTGRLLHLSLDTLAGGQDAVIAPSVDGGYGVLGLRQTARALFQGIDWGSPAVMAETRQRLVQLNWRYNELPECRDLDRIEDVRWLQSGRSGLALHAELQKVLDQLPVQGDARRG